MKFAVLKETQDNSGLYQETGVMLDDVTEREACTIAGDLLMDTKHRHALLPIEAIKRDRSALPSPMPADPLPETAAETAAPAPDPAAVAVAAAAPLASAPVPAANVGEVAAAAPAAAPSA